MKENIDIEKLLQFAYGGAEPGLLFPHDHEQGVTELDRLKARLKTQLIKEIGPMRPPRPPASIFSTVANYGSARISATDSGINLDDAYRHPDFKNIQIEVSKLNPKRHISEADARLLAQEIGVCREADIDALLYKTRFDLPAIVSQHARGPSRPAWDYLASFHVICVSTGEPVTVAGAVKIFSTRQEADEFARREGACTKAHHIAVPATVRPRAYLPARAAGDRTNDRFRRLIVGEDEQELKALTGRESQMVKEGFGLERGDSVWDPKRKPQQIVEWCPHPFDVLANRAEYIIWRGALIDLASALSSKLSVGVTSPASPPRPWLDPAYYDPTVSDSPRGSACSDGVSFGDFDFEVETVHTKSVHVARAADW